MSGLSVSVPPRLPTPPDHLVGRVLRIPGNCRRYRNGDLVLMVRRVRVDISQWYGGNWVWLEGDEFDERGHTPGTPTQALVHVSACTGNLSTPG